MRLQVHWVWSVVLPSTNESIGFHWIGVLSSWSGEAKDDEKEHADVDVQCQSAVDVLLSRQLNSPATDYHLRVEHQPLHANGKYKYLNTAIQQTGGVLSVSNATVISRYAILCNGEDVVWPLTTMN